MKAIGQMEVGMGELKVWETAEKMFPEYANEEYKDLKEFVGKHGEPLPLVVSEDYRIVDGYNRYRLYRKDGRKDVTVQLYQYENEQEMEIHCIVLNTKRRQIDTASKVKMALRLAKLYKPSAEDTKRKLSEAGMKGGRGNKASVTTGTVPFKSSLSKACKETGVSKNTVYKYQRIKATGDMELIADIESHRISVEKAYELSLRSEKARTECRIKTVADAERKYGEALKRIQFHYGDCITVMKTLEANSINCCVTSPPYWRVREYLPDDDKNKAYELGNEPTPEAFVENLVKVFREVRRLLRDDGTLWLNLGDKYIGGGNGNYERDDDSIWGDDIRRGVKFGKSTCNIPGYKNGDLAGTPWKVAEALRKDGWYLRADIIWHKQSCRPETAKARPSRCHEYIFLLAKSRDYYYDFKSMRSVRCKHAKYFDSNSHEDYRSMESIWSVPHHPTRLAEVEQRHFAMFPQEIILPCILAGCPTGGTVLDPFGGSGTTGITAAKHGRNSVLIDLNQNYRDLFDKKLRHEFFGTETVELNSLKEASEKVV